MNSAADPSPHPAEEPAARAYPPELDEWVNQVATRLGLDPQDIPVAALLELTREVAHGVSRPAAPVTAYILGLAQGAGGGSLPELRAAIADLIAK